MMYNKLSINLGWHNNIDIKSDYYEWFDICKKNKISFVRIFLCSWSINALYNKKYLNVLQNIIKQAYENKIEICLVLNNFVDYNINNYLDINNKKYSWINNPYYPKYKKVKNFFSILDKDYMDSIKNILSLLDKYSNVKYIEIMNEIDQINCPNRILINWTNNLIKNLKVSFKNRYIFTCSISNHQLFKKFKKNMNCYVDLHFYSFPYENAIENIEYINSKNNILYLGEYAKYSDSSYLNNLDSKIYFASGLWAAYFYQLEYSPLHWWWKDLLNNSDYIKIINIYKSVVNKLGVIKNIEKEDIQYKICSRINNDLEKNKIKERLQNIFKHPLFIFRELKNIKKFVNKKFTKQPNVIFRKILIDNNIVYYLECNNDILIETDLNKTKIINLLSGVEKKYTKKIPKGLYLIV